MSDSASANNNSNVVIWPELWSAAAVHRNKIGNLLCSLSRGTDSRLCVWGAGRTTDLDLMQLVKHFSVIDLVDLDPNVTHAALLQRGFQGHSNVKAVGGFDVTGLGALWETFTNSPHERELQAIIESCHSIRLGLEKYDVVASTCLVSQLIKQAIHRIECSGASPHISQELIAKVTKAIREQHLDLITEHTIGGGSAVLISDFTSAEALPAILESDADLQQLFLTDVVQGNHFPGLNPRLLSESLRVPRIAEKIEQVQLTAPWVWDSLESQYLCMAYRLKKSIV